jgi:hypothetical protein
MQEIKNTVIANHLLIVLRIFLKVKIFQLGRK